MKRRHALLMIGIGAGLFTAGCDNGEANEQRFIEGVKDSVDKVKEAFDTLES
jgi:hypothetical protein